MKRIVFPVLFLALVLIFTGCGSKKELPFTNSPESSIKIDYMEDIIQNEDKYAEMYIKYTSARIFGAVSEEFEQFISELKNESEEKAVKFIDNADKFIALRSILSDDTKEEVKQDAKQMIDGYLRRSRLGDENTTFDLSPELEAQNPIGRVKEYMENNKIKVTEIDFPEGFENVNFDIYPFKFTYRYVLKGTVGNRPFEKEVVQDFYYGIDWSKGKEKENMKTVIEYIHDVKEDN